MKRQTPRARRPGERVAESRQVDSPDPARSTPAWQYALVLIAVAAGVVLPGPAVVVTFTAIVLLVFVWYFWVEPDRMLPIYIIGVPLVAMLPKGLSPIPGLNFESFFILGLLAAAVKVKMAETPPVSPNEFGRPVGYLLVVLIISALFSVFTGSAQGHSWEQGWYKLSSGYVFASLKNVVFYPLLAPIAFRLIRSPGLMRASVQMIAVVTIILSLESLWALWTGDGSGEIGVQLRAEGVLFNEPNVLGGFLALMCGIFFSLTLASKLEFRERMFYAGTTAATGAALIYTFSRGAWLGLMAGLVVFAVLRGARAWAAIAVLVLTATFWVPDSVIERVSMTVLDSGGFQTDDAELEGSAQSRLDRWAALPEQWIQAPLLGHGYMSYGRVWGHLGRFGEARGSHSSIINITVEQGLAGLVAYAWLIWVLYRNAREVRRRSGDAMLQALATGLTVSLACLVVLDASGNRFLNGPTMAFIWIIGGGLARVARSLPPEPGSSRSKQDRRIRLATEA